MKTWQCGAIFGHMAARKPVAVLPARGHIGFQGKHAGAPIWFRKLRIKVVGN